MILKINPKADLLIYIQHYTPHFYIVILCRKYPSSSRNI